MIAASYRLSFQIESVKRSVELLLAEMTSGIQYVSTRDGVRMDRVQDTLPHVDGSVQGEVAAFEKLDEDTYLVKFAIPAANLDPDMGGIANLWPMVAGEVFNLHFIKSATLIELELPPAFEGHYQGPQFGIEGIRSMLGVTEGPLFGSIIKPNLGLTPDETARVVAILAAAGFDFIKDDEICVNPALCPLGERVRAVVVALEKVKQKSGRNVLYAANVTSDFASLGRAAETALQSGARGLMVDPFCTGFTALDFLRRRFEVPIYAHRVGYGLYCLGSSYSISFEVLTRLFRLLGADFSHAGGIWGKSETARQKVSELLDILRGPGGVAPAWPVVTGISLENMADYHGFYGDDTMFMDHIDIYTDEESSAKKLEMLKKNIVDG
jgi:ribulose 1,5-bisphosphate carboxylase large subunit-like protein